MAKCAWLVLAFAGLLTGASAKAPDVTDSSFVTADGQSDLQQSVVIKAPVAVLWKSFIDPREFAR